MLVLWWCYVAVMLVLWWCYVGVMLVLAIPECFNINNKINNWPSNTNIYCTCILYGQHVSTYFKVIFRPLYKTQILWILRNGIPYTYICVLYCIWKSTYTAVQHVNNTRYSVIRKENKNFPVTEDTGTVQGTLRGLNAASKNWHSEDRDCTAFTRALVLYKYGTCLSLLL